MFRFLLLRFLPRRLLPLLTVVEVVLLVRRLRASRRSGPSGRRVSSRQPAAATVTDVSPPTAGGRDHGG